jgi:2-dehydro-3-deoxyphosphogluconate aldolase/(4S)-4-hydroxy-2-oxoglutarate aldolase
MTDPDTTFGPAMTAAATAKRLTGMRVIPVLRLATREAAAAAIECLVEAGFDTVELTLTTPDAITLIVELRERMPGSFLVGAGTVLDLDTARRCIDSGADYLVSPCLVPGLARLATDAGCAALIGGYTPGEVLTAWREGAHIVKVFPAGTGGPAYLQSIHAVFPDIPLCPTGGVSVANMLDYFKAGAIVVGVGNNIVDQKALAAGDRVQVIQHAHGLLDLARQHATSRPGPVPQGER